MAEPYSMDLVAGVRYLRGFRYKVAGAGRPLASWRAQARRKEDPNAGLIVDLQPYLAIDAGDDTLLWLSIPGTVTAEIGQTKMPTAAYWDLFVWEPGASEDDGVLLVQGPVTMDRATTDVR